MEFLNGTLFLGLNLSVKLTRTMLLKKHVRRSIYREMKPKESTFFAPSENWQVACSLNKNERLLLQIQDAKKTINGAKRCAIFSKL